MILFCLAEQLVDTGSRRIRFQQCVIDHCDNVHDFLLSTRTVLPLTVRNTSYIFSHYHKGTDRLVLLFLQV